MRKAENLILWLTLVAVVACGAFAAHLMVAPRAVNTTHLSQSQTDKLNINTATLQQLEALTEIGPKLAESIIQYRNEHGPFETIGQLLDVPGIGEKTLETIASYITTGGSQ